MQLTERYFQFGRRAAAASDPSVLTPAPTPTPTPGTYPLLSIVAQYGALALGVFVEPLLHHLRKGGGELTWQWSHVLLSLAVAMLLIPGAYRPQSPSPQPRFLQFCVLFAAGVGWRATFDRLIA
jgi:hypothetical protein